MRYGLALAGAALFAILPVASAFAQEGVILSDRERRDAERVQVGDGSSRVYAPGIPFLYGLGDAVGDPSGVPLVNGRTPSVYASTPSGGVVPGQEPE